MLILGRTSETKVSVIKSQFGAGWGVKMENIVRMNCQAYPINAPTILADTHPSNLEMY